MNHDTQSDTPDLLPFALFVVFMAASGIAKLAGADDVFFVQGVVGLGVAFASVALFFIRRNAPRRRTYLYVAGTCLLLGGLLLLPSS